MTGDGAVELFERLVMDDPEALSFLDDRIAEMDERSRPTTDERTALEKRLRAELWPADGRVDETSWFVAVQPGTDTETGEPARRLFLAPRSSALRRVWPTVFREWQLERVPQLAALAARATLAAYSDDTKATEANAADELTTAVRTALPGLLAAVGDPPPNDAHARAVAWLRERPLTKVQSYARAVAKLAWTADKWDDPWTAAMFVADAWWKLKVRNELPAYARPGLPSDVLSNITQVRHLQRDDELSRQRSQAAGKEITTWAATTSGVPVVGLDVANLDASLVDPKLLRGLPAQRLLRFVMHRAHELYDETGDLGSATRITVDGGWRGLAEALGMRTGEKATKVAELTAKAMQAAWVKTPRGEGGLFLVHHEKRGPGRREEVSLTIHENGPLSPRFVARELQGHSPKIVPVPLPSLMPPMVGRPNEHGAIATLQLLTLRELRLKATELVEQGAVAISRARWNELAKESGVPLPLVDELLTAWRTGDEDAPPFIVTNGELVDLAPAYAKERRFIEDGGRLSLEGRRRGRRSQRKRLRG
jgi:hypothetical protein